MAHIRTIKPEFFTDPDNLLLTYLERLTFIGLWTQADRMGRLEDDPRSLKLRLFPDQKINMESILSRLSKKQIKRYTASDGRKYIEILNFLKHQRPHHLELPSLIPSQEGSLRILGSPPTEAIRQQIYERDRFMCAYCGLDLSTDVRRICLDHIIPLSRNGGNFVENLVTSCKKCNARKYDKTPEEAGLPWPRGLGKEAYDIPLTGGEVPLTPPSPSPTKEGKIKEGKRKEGKRMLTPGFAPFWESYPRKVAKKDALRAWAKINPENGLVGKIMAKLAEVKSSEQWTRDGGKFIPYPATWLNGARWEDEEAPGRPTYDVEAVARAIGWKGAT